MKKILVALALAAFASTASAAIAGGPHDLNAAGGSLPACSYCHSPHLWNVSNLTGGPLWNRNASTATFTMYTSTTLNSTIADVGTNSKTCLSCHDGVTNMSTVVNGVDLAPRGVMGGGPTGYAVGLDLRDDHPVGIPYNAADPEYVAAPTLPLYNSQVECGSCHDPHGEWDATRFGLAFLRASTDLCAECHAK